MASKNIFRLSNDGEYWIGTTLKGEEFTFDGEKCDEIMIYTWFKNIDGYIMSKINNKYCVLHHKVYKKPKKGMVIDHINNNPLDNRTLNLREVTKGENNRNKNTKNKFGLVGLSMHKSGRFSSTFTINKHKVHTSLKSFDEAYIDNLIIQKNFGFKHNSDKFYLLNNIDDNTIREITELINKKIKKLESKEKEYKTKKENKYQLSDDNKFYWVMDKKGDKFKISKCSLEKVQKGLWSVGKYRNKNYISGRYDGKSDKVLLHRYLLEIDDKFYSDWFVDHLNGDETDNRLENLVITNNDGNQVNKKGKGYRKKDNYFLVECFSHRFNGAKCFKNELEAIEEVKRRKKILLTNRLCFKTKEELDCYLIKKLY